MPRRSFAMLAASLLAAPLLAAPAPWYKWASRQADAEICAQVSPGKDWYKVRGPFVDAHCAKRGRPGEALPGTQGAAPRSGPALPA